MVAGTQHQRGFWSNIHLQRAVKHLPLQARRLGHFTAVVIDRHKAPAQAAFGIECAGGIQLCAVVIHRAARQQHLRLALRQRALVGEVDDTASLASAKHAIGTPQQADTVKLRHVQTARARARRACRTTVIAHIADLQTPRKVSGIQPALLACHARGLVHDVIQRAQRLIVHALARDDRDGLRNFAQGLRRLAHFHSLGHVRVAGFAVDARGQLFGHRHLIQRSRS